MKVISIRMSNGAVYWVLGFDDIEQFGDTVLAVMERYPAGRPAFATFEVFDLDGRCKTMLDVTSIQAAWQIEVQD